MANKGNLRAWVTALRSGKYPQTSGVLKNDDGYCCLGVACDISGLGSWNHANNYTVLGDERMGSLPERVLAFYDLGIDDMVRVSRVTVVSVLGQAFWDSMNNAMFIHDDYCNLANLNDHGASFSDIADVIEKEFAL